MAEVVGNSVSVDSSMLGISILAQAVGAAPVEVAVLTSEEYPLETRYLSLLSASAAVLRLLARELHTSPENLVDFLRSELVKAAVETEV